jgi:hypothetical protein
MPSSTDAEDITLEVADILGRQKGDISRSVPSLST